jgi:phosphate transport system protein
MSFEPNNPYLTTRITLTKELNRLKDGILQIGNVCCQGLGISISSFTVNSKIFETKIEELFKGVQDSAEGLEHDCLTILSLQQPLLKDLRLVIGSLKILSHLTRIASYSRRMVKILSTIEDKTLIPPELRTIAENCNIMLSDVLKAFQSGSTELAHELVMKDKENDLLHDASFKTLIKRITEDKEELVEMDAHLLTSVRFLERTGDLIASIAKEVYFIYSGRKFRN